MIMCFIEIIMLHERYIGGSDFSIGNLCDTHMWPILSLDSMNPTILIKLLDFDHVASECFVYFSLFSVIWSHLEFREWIQYFLKCLCMSTNDDDGSELLLEILIAYRAALSASSFPFILLYPGVHIKLLCMFDLWIR